MIDLDVIDAGLDRALNVATRAKPVRAPVPEPTPPPGRTTRTTRRARTTAPRRRERRVDPAAAAGEDNPLRLLEAGRLADADARMAVATDRREIVTWATMRALLVGNEVAARAGVDELLALARAGGDQETWDRYWAQRFWAAFEWGGAEERRDVLDHCRERAYRFDDLEWWGRLTLLLASTGKADEATRASDDAQLLLERAARDGRWLDAATDLVDGAAVLGDARRAAALARTVRWPAGRLVVVGDGVVCKGSIDRYTALGHVAAGNWAAAAECFRRADEAHRDLGAGPLLARTRLQASAARVAA